MAGLSLDEMRRSAMQHTAMGEHVIISALTHRSAQFVLDQFDEHLCLGTVTGRKCSGRHLSLMNGGSLYFTSGKDDLRGRRGIVFVEGLDRSWAHRPEFQNVSRARTWYERILQESV